MTPLDTRLPVATPEGIDLMLIPAGPVQRGIAWAIDTLLRTVLVVLMVMSFSVLLPFAGGVGAAFMVLGWFLINWWYPVLFEVLAGGATPGKKALRLRVVHIDATPVGWSASIVRNLLRQIDFLPLFYGLGLFSVMATRRFQRLGDLAAGTLVVHRSERFERAQAAMPEGPSAAPPLPLTVEEQQAVVSFAERCPRLHPDRANELAELLSPLTGCHGAESTQTVLAWARWIKGEARA
jgi:uncharacterized RDD family membrane protein YckC